MTNTNIYLLKLIEDNLSNEEICDKLNITKKQLKNRIETIKNSGYNLDKKYSYNGTYNYYMNYIPESDIDKSKFTINDVHDNFRIVTLSDTHLGHSKSDLRYLYEIYNYCLKNNINIVVHCRDLLEGTFQSKYNHEEQIEYVLENYPSVKNILTFIALGNHEEEFLTDCGYNLKTILEKERDDLISLGYGRSRLDVNGNNIFVSHKKNLNQEYGIKLSGHSHRFRFYADNYGPIIIVPTLSNYLHTTDYPGALDLEVNLDSNEKFNKLILKHLTINNNDIRETSYIEYPLKRSFSIKR